MIAFQSKMKQGEITKIGGQYCCLYHLKNKIKLVAGSKFPSCNFAGLNCIGEWHLIKEIKEKTWGVKQEKIKRRKQAQNKQSTFKNSLAQQYKEPTKYNKWDIEKG